MAITNPQDDYVQVAPDSTGKKMDNAALTRDDGTVVERERVSVGSDENPRLQVAVGAEVGRGTLYVGGEVVEQLMEINQSLKMILCLLMLETNESLDTLTEMASLYDGD